jgi:hypothetical protein
MNGVVQEPKVFVEHNELRSHKPKGTPLVDEDIVIQQSFESINKFRVSLGAYGDDSTKIMHYGLQHILYNLPKSKRRGSI